MRGVRQIGAALAVVLGVFSQAAPAAAQGVEAQDDARLKQAAQHFADLEDDQARALLEELSAEGVADADVLLGYLYADPLYDRRDYEKAMSVFQKAAADGNEEAIFQLAESRFWPAYSEWTLTPDEKAVRPKAEDVFELLQRIVGEKEPPFVGHNAAKWRLGWLCTFGGYDCGMQGPDQAVRVASLILGDNLRAITAAFGIMRLEQAGDAGSAENAEERKNYLAIGLAHADPFVAALATDPLWRNVATPAQCLEAAKSNAPGRLLALRNGVAKRYAGQMDLDDCYSGEQLVRLEDELVSALDYMVRAFGYDTSWSLSRCYLEPEGSWFGDCLLYAVRDHFFICTKLSMPRYFNDRFGIEYRRSKRYERCREMLLGNPPLHNRI